MTIESIVILPIFIFFDFNHNGWKLGILCLGPQTRKHTVHDTRSLFVLAHLCRVVHSAPTSSTAHCASAVLRPLVPTRKIGGGWNLALVTHCEKIVRKFRCRYITWLLNINGSEKLWVLLHYQRDILK